MFGVVIFQKVQRRGLGKAICIHTCCRQVVVSDYHCNQMSWNLDSRRNDFVVLLSFRLFDIHNNRRSHHTACNQGSQYRQAGSTSAGHAIVIQTSTADLSRIAKLVGRKIGQFADRLVDPVAHFAHARVDSCTYERNTVTLFERTIFSRQTTEWHGIKKED